MAVQIAYDNRIGIQYKLTVGEGVLKDTPVYVNDLLVYTLEDADANNQAASVLFVWLVVRQAVTAVDADGDSAVAVGQSLYVQSDGEINKDVGGKLIGYALAAVAEGATATIEVGLSPVNTIIQEVEGGA